MSQLIAYKRLIGMNMPLDHEEKVNFTTTLSALIQENLSIKIQVAEKMDTGWLKKLTKAEFSCFSNGILVRILLLPGGLSTYFDFYGIIFQIFSALPGLPFPLRQ